ncbi:MAG TPA: methyltransferase domain-containing protein [Mycobacterium sp.]|nr:methyltransferase domain-containing protein [Mycobacterium sp.]
MFSEGEGYERFMGRWSRRLAPLFVTFAGVVEGDRVLDVGSGTGALSAAAADAGARVTGVEPSAAYVRYAQQHVQAGRVQFETGDAMDLPYDDGVFDRTLSMLVLNFVPAPGIALDQMIRVTRPGGLVAAAVWDYGDGMQMLRAFWDEAVALDPNAASRDERYMPLCPHGALTDLWRSRGLQNVEEQPLTVDTKFSSFDDYWQPFLSGQGPAGRYVMSLDESARDALENRLRSRLAVLGLSLRARAWAVRGVVI